MTGGDRYERGGTMEHGVHGVTSPKLNKRFKDSLLEDFTNLLGNRAEGMSGGPGGIEGWNYDRIAKYMNTMIKSRQEDEEWSNKYGN